MSSGSPHKLIAFGGHRFGTGMPSAMSCGAGFHCTDCSMAWKNTRAAGAVPAGTVLNPAATAADPLPSTEPVTWLPCPELRSAGPGGPAGNSGHAAAEVLVHRGRVSAV